MVDRYMRLPKDKVLEVCVYPCKRIPPNLLTALAFALGVVGAVLTALGEYGWGLGFWLANRFIDGLDGAVARYFNKQSDLGGYLDLLLDFVVYALYPVALILATPSQSGFIALAALLSTFYINAGSWLVLSALLEKRQYTYKGTSTSIAMPGALIEGTETIIFYVLFLLMPHALTELFSLMALLVLISAGQRLVWAVRHL